MKDEIIYMMCVIAVGFSVNYGLRALPFLLFAGRDRELPRWVERFGNVISPLIIACLIVYSYSGLAWRSAWPYLAGVLTIGLQLWKRNPLASIVAGTVLYMCLLSCGCASRPPLSVEDRDPSVRVTTRGVFFGESPVEIAEVLSILEDYEVGRDRTIHIRVEKDVRDLSQARMLMGTLARGGYSNCVLVTERHADSFATGKKPEKAVPKAARQPKAGVRYKKATE